MFSRKRIVFVSALAAAVSVSTISLATLGRKERTVAAPMRMKVLRLKDKKHDKPTAAEVAAYKAQNERKLKVREFKDMPVTVKEVRNLQSDTWYKDLEIEVKNITNKPIYSMLVYLQFPDDREGVSAGAVSGILMSFGLNKYIDLKTMADFRDPHLNPSETYVFTIPAQYKKGLRVQNDTSPEKFRKLELHVGLIGFGDGTGFSAQRRRDYRNRQQPHEKKNHHLIRSEKSALMKTLPQSGCGSCAQYVLHPEPYQICWDYSQRQACDSRLATTSATEPCT